MSLIKQLVDEITEIGLHSKWKKTSEELPDPKNIKCIYAWDNDSKEIILLKSKDDDSYEDDRYRYRINPTNVYQYSFTEFYPFWKEREVIDEPPEQWKEELKK